MPVPFALEQMFTKCVQTGNTAELKRLLDTYLSGTAGTLSSTPLRQSKDTSIAIAAVISRAAIAGGLSAESCMPPQRCICAADGNLRGGKGCLHVVRTHGNST